MSGRTPSRVARAAALWVAIAATGAPRVAAAQSSADVDSARAYFVEATKLGNEGRWREARELYARSLQLKAAPITRYSLGVAQRETMRFADALSSFRAFLTEPSSAATAVYTTSARAAVAALEKSIGQVTIRVEPRPLDGLTLTIDGQPVAPSGDLPRDIDPGAHEIVAHAPGFVHTTAHFSVAAGAEVAVALTLTRATPVMAAHPLAPLAAPMEPVVDPPAQGGPLPFVLLGVGGALFAAGLTVGLVGVGEASHATTRDGADASAARSKAMAGDVMASLGVASAAAGVVVLLVRRHSSQPATGAERFSGLGVRF